MLRAVLASLIGALLWEGCGEEGLDELEGDRRRPRYPNPAFHRFHGNADFAMNSVKPEWQKMSSYQVSGGMHSPPTWSQPTVNPARIENLQSSAARINDRREDLKRVMEELDMEQREFQSELGSVNAEHENSKRQFMSEYTTYINSLRNMAAFQVSYPTDQVYVNAYSGAASSASIRPAPILPITLPSPITPPSTISMSTGVDLPTLPAVPGLPTLPSVSVAPAPDYSSYAATLLSFIETCSSLCKQSPTGGLIGGRLEKIRLDVASRQSSGTLSQESLTGYANSVNGLLAELNKLPRSKTISEVWVDPQLVSGKEDQRKLDQLVLQESTSKVALASFSSDEELNSQSAIPNVFSLSQNKNSHNHRIKVFRDRKAGQIKLIATCHYKRFSKHRGERFFLAFTCQDTNSSFGALADAGRNRLSESVLKVICHSKEFAKKLILNQEARIDRCNLSKWSSLAQGIGQPIYRRLDRGGRRAWAALQSGTGCFSRTEGEINANCTNGKAGGKNGKNNDD